MLVKRICPACLNEFIAKRRDKIFCSNPCAQKYIDFRRRDLNKAPASDEAFAKFVEHVAQQAALLEEATAKAA